MLNRYKLFFILWAVLLITGCRKDSDDSELDKAYLGTLSLEYFKSFPSLVNALVVDIEISKSGLVTISNPTVVNYSAVDEVTKTVKLREEGSITVNSLSGKINIVNEERIVEITATTEISGTSTSWGWDNELGWVFSQSIPFNLTDPIQKPISFKLKDATLTGDEISETVTGTLGDAMVTWTLLLVPKLTK